MDFLDKSALLLYFTFNDSLSLSKILKNQIFQGNSLSYNLSRLKFTSYTATNRFKQKFKDQISELENDLKVTMSDIVVCWHFKDQIVKFIIIGKQPDNFCIGL